MATYGKTLLLYLDPSQGNLVDHHEPGSRTALAGFGELARQAGWLSKVDSTSQHAWIRPLAAKIIHHNFGHQETPKQNKRQPHRNCQYLLVTTETKCGFTEKQQTTTQKLQLVVTMENTTSMVTMVTINLASFLWTYHWYGYMYMYSTVCYLFNINDTGSNRRTISTVCNTVHVHVWLLKSPGEDAHKVL